MLRTSTRPIANSSRATASTFTARRRAEFVTERPTGGQFTHEPGGILADEMGVRQCENPPFAAFLRHGNSLVGASELSGTAPPQLLVDLRTGLGKTVVVAAYSSRGRAPPMALLEDDADGPSA